MRFVLEHFKKVLVTCEGIIFKVDTVTILVFVLKMSGYHVSFSCIQAPLRLHFMEANTKKCRGFIIMQ